MDEDGLRFGGRAQRIAEQEFQGSFTQDRDGTALSRLFSEYSASAKPRSLDQWLRNRLAQLFLAAKERPRWVERHSPPQWPFLNGVPMIFIEQIEVPTSAIVAEQLAPDTVLYIFGARVDVEHGWVMEYRVVEQHKGLP